MIELFTVSFSINDKRKSALFEIFSSLEQR